MALWHTLFGCLIWQQQNCYYVFIVIEKKRLFWYDFSKAVLISFFFHFLCLFKSFVIKLFSWIFHALELSLLFAVLVGFFLGWNTFFFVLQCSSIYQKAHKTWSSNCIATTVSAIYFCQISFVGPCEIWNNHLKHQRQANHFFPQHLGFESRG